MLNEAEREEIGGIARRSATKQAGCLEALKAVQKSRGWVSDESLKEAAAILGLTAEEMDGVATFYSQIYRRPVGRHVILLCRSVSCWVMGADTILTHLQSRLGLGLGETGGDGRFTLLSGACLGVCDHAPAMMIDDELFGDLSPERIDEILERHR